MLTEESDLFSTFSIKSKYRAIAWCNSAMLPWDMDFISRVHYPRQIHFPPLVQPKKKKRATAHNNFIPSPQPLDTDSKELKYEVAVIFQFENKQ